MSASLSGNGWGKRPRFAVKFCRCLNFLYETQMFRYGFSLTRTTHHRSAWFWIVRTCTRNLLPRREIGLFCQQRWEMSCGNKTENQASRVNRAVIWRREQTVPAAPDALRRMPWRHSRIPSARILHGDYSQPTQILFDHKIWGGRVIRPAT